MIVSAAYLTVSCVGAALSLLAFFPGPRKGKIPGLFFLSAWMVGELAPVHIAWQAVATALFGLGGAFGHWPGWIGLAVTLGSWALLIAGVSRARRTAAVVEEAMVGALGPGYLRRSGPDGAGTVTEGAGRLWPNPFRSKHPLVERIKDISYGPAGRRNLLDVYRPRSAAGPCPVLVHVHGSAWSYSSKDRQGRPLMLHLASRGWVCVAPNYRLSPSATFPDHLVDVKRVLAWVREHAAEYDADPALIVVAGGSAGGHLAALAGLTQNDPEYQAGFEKADTSVAAVVSLYGAYDLLDRHRVRPDRFQIEFLQEGVLKCSPEESPDAWEKASPYGRVNPDAPPFFVAHGRNDSLLFCEDAQFFVEALRAVSRQPVVYAELPGGQHAFDTFHSIRSMAVIDGVAGFLEWVRSSRAGTTEVRT